MQKFKLNDKVTVCEKPKCGAYGNCEGIIIQIANYKVSVGNIETLVSIKSKSINRPIGPFRFNELTKIEA